MVIRKCLLTTFVLLASSLTAGTVYACATQANSVVKPVSDDLSGWHDLYVGLDWYVRQPGPEQAFAGCLDAVPADGLASGLQRPAFYRLGELTVYTGADRPAPLERLIGKDVVIRGKAVEFSLEGTIVREIWPAAIRSAETNGGH